jgi:UDP-glucose 4-epimerase
MRILITGGFGFVGGRLAEHLFRLDHEIVLGSQSLKDVPNWLPQARVTKINWNDDDALEECCSRSDVIVHAAGINSGGCVGDPVAALEFNGLATARLTAAARRAKVKRLIYLSTAHVYAAPLAGVITEETCPRNLHPYATSHLAGEYSVCYANQREELEGVVLRLANAFGRPVHENVDCWMLFVNDLCRQAATMRSMTLRTSGLQTRDFVTLHDVVRAVAHLIDAPKSDIGDGLFNVGSGCSKSVIVLADLIRSRCLHVLGYSPEIICPEPSGHEENPSFDYRIDKLLKTGFVLSDNSEKEIDDLLIACKRFFTADH